MELVVDGRKVFAATGGQPFDAGLPAVIFIHGAGMDHTLWQLQSRYLAHHGHGVLAVDLPGHGRSEGPGLDSIGAHADWLAVLISVAGIARTALVGHSMGALIALEAAARHPEKVGALALLGAAATMPVHPDLLAAAARGEPIANELIVAWGYGKPAHLGAHRAPGIWMLGGGRRLLEHTPAGALARDLAACNAYKGANAAAARIACPTLLILGALDRMTPAKSGRALAAAIRDARCLVLPGCGHIMMVERPDAVLDALRALLSLPETAGASGVPAQ
jgi:pimeloyl-ACP methyl ester carboxylesterase